MIFQKVDSAPKKTKKTSRLVTPKRYIKGRRLFVRKCDGPARIWMFKNTGPPGKPKVLFRDRRGFLKRSVWFWFQSSDARSSIKLSKFPGNSLAKITDRHWNIHKMFLFPWKVCHSIRRLIPKKTTFFCTQVRCGGRENRVGRPYQLKFIHVKTPNEGWKEEEITCGYPLSMW